jgi:hypothetical protein
MLLLFHTQLNKFPKELVLYKSYSHYRKALTPDVFFHLHNTLACPLPRFLIQIIDRDFHRRHSSVSVAFFIAVVNAGWILYGDQIELNGDDQALFEHLLLSQFPNREEILRLVKDFGFLPTAKSNGLDELLYKVCHGVLTKRTVNSTWMCLTPWLLMDSYEKTTMMLSGAKCSISQLLPLTTGNFFLLTSSYIEAGFILTPKVLASSIQIPSPQVLAFLKTQLPLHDLTILAQSALTFILGPNKNSFSPESADHILQSFKIQTNVLNAAIYNDKTFPNTRAYLGNRPIDVWRWVLRRFGSSHGIPNTPNVKHTLPRVSPMHLVAHKQPPTCTTYTTPSSTQAWHSLTPTSKSSLVAFCISACPPTQYIFLNP